VGEHAHNLVTSGGHNNRFAREQTTTTQEVQQVTALQDIAVDSIRDDTTSLGEFAGSVLLVVNVASKCGLTPQYEGLEALHQRYEEEGLVVLGFPANNFGGQEPGSNDEIAEFCSTNYSVTFPLFAKISVVGDDQHPLYAELTAQAPTADGKDEFRANLRGHGMTPTEDPDVLWNFEKFLVSRQGQVVGRFAPTVTPDDPALVQAIEDELSR
jgi:glutathione peroxidase